MVCTALVHLDRSKKKTKKAAFETRDARKVERKKFGKHKVEEALNFQKITYVS